MVCDKGGCDKDGMWQMVWKIVCDKDGVWQSCMWWYVTDGVWQSCMWKMVCDKVGCVTGGRRDGRRPGIQNQKQDPHTKLWGIINVSSFTIHVLLYLCRDSESTHLTFWRPPMDRHNRCRGGLYLWSNFAMSASFEGFRLRVCIPSQPALQRIQNSKATKTIPIPSSNYQSHMSHYQINIIVMLHNTL